MVLLNYVIINVVMICHESEPLDRPVATSVIGAMTSPKESVWNITRNGAEQAENYFEVPLQIVHSSFGRPNWSREYYLKGKCG
jgi:hypothetical protein